MARLKEKYQSNVIPALRKAYNYKNVMQVPKLVKISVNVGVGEATQNRPALDNARKELETITGQHALITKARKSISNFKLREGNPIGTKTTLRSNVMYEFADRLFSIVLPRIRDFNGVSNSGFDGRGNYTLGLKEQIVFPEINYDKVDKIRGLNITFVTTAKTDEEAYTLLKEMGMPFAQK